MGNNKIVTGHDLKELLDCDLPKSDPARFEHERTCYGRRNPPPFKCDCILKPLLDELDEYDILFALQWKRSREADEAYKKAHGITEDVIQDLGTLLTWLLQERELWMARYAELAKAIAERPK